MQPPSLLSPTPSPRTVPRNITIIPTSSNSIIPPAPFHFPYLTPPSLTPPPFPDPNVSHSQPNPPQTTTTPFCPALDFQLALFSSPSSPHPPDSTKTDKPTKPRKKPKTPRTQWTEHDIELLLKLASDNNITWAMCAAAFPQKRTGNACRKKYERLMRHEGKGRKKKTFGSGHAGGRESL